MGRNVNTTRCKNAKVYFRIFPMVKMHWEHVKILEDMKTLYIRYLQDFGVGREECVPSYWKFETDGIFYNNTQDEIYDSVMSGVIENVVEGCNAIILAYGQTGSGKSLTVHGLLNSFKDRGIAPRVISALFKKKESLKNECKMCIQMSYIETKKMYISDLLNPDSEVFDSQGLKNIKTLKMKDEYNAMKTLFQAEGRRQFAEDISRKHSANGVLTLHVTSKPLNHTDPVKRMSKIHIVDLAGVDTFGNFTSIHKTLFEVGNANLVKSQLEQFVLILCQNIPEQILVKQHLNVLIQYLGDSLNAHSILRFIGHLRTDKENLLVTISMLRFGQIIRGLKPQRLQPNVSDNPDEKYQLLQEELLELQKERDLNLMLMNSDLSTNLTQERIKHMQHVAAEYLQSKTNEIVLLNVTDTNTVLKVFKNLYNKLEAEKIECTKIAYEKAYEDALANVKRVSSKTESVRSTKSSKKGSRKSVKSKESGSIADSAPILSRGSKKIGRASTSRTGSPTKLSETRGKSGQSLSKYKSQDRQSLSKTLRRTKTSSFNMMKRSSVSKRRSNSSTATVGTGVRDSILEEVPLPELVPEHDEAWNLFITDSEYNYNDLTAAVKQGEENAKGAHRDYLTEVKNLQKFIEVVDIRKNELQKAQMQRLLKKIECDEEGNVIISDLEKLCHENLKKAHDELVEQQEKMLKVQTEFRIALEGYQNAKQAISDKYEMFCQEKFQAPVPDLEILSAQAIEESIEVAEAVEEEPRCASILQEEVVRYDSLKQLMERQIQKKIINREKSKKWVQSCKT